MKVNFNLLPGEYRCERRNYLAIVVLIGALIIGIILNISTFFIMSVYYGNVKKMAISGINELKRKIEDNKIIKNGLISKLKGITFDIDKKIKLNEKIILFNNISQAFLWSKFFDELEKSMPKRVWIKKMDYSNLPHFILICEAADQILPIKFEQNLIKSPYFENVFLGDTVLDRENMSVLFKISFDFKYKRDKK